MATAINAARLPVFVVEGKTHIVEVKTNPELTRLVDSSKGRHSYLIHNSSSGIPADDIAKLALGLLQKKAIRNALDKFVLQIARQLKENPKVGYLIKVNKTAALEGTEALGANLITPIGFGIEPLDALAESYRIPAYRPAPSTMPDASEYVWYTWDGDKLKPARYELDFPRQLERDAHVEANRRFVQGNVKIETATGIARAQVAEYWRIFAKTRLSLIQDLDRKKRIADMNARLQAAQDQFNFAYENYQTAAREMARNAAEMQTLERIGAVLSLLKVGADAVQAAQDWRASRQTELGNLRDTHRVQAQGAQQEMIQGQQAIVNEWSSVPGSVWQSPVMPSVDVKVEIIESKPYGSGSETTQVIIYRE